MIVLIFADVLLSEPFLLLLLDWRVALPTFDGLEGRLPLLLNGVPQRRTANGLTDSLQRQ